MNSFARFVFTLYSHLLRLYPRRFQQEFAEEMRDVFSDLLENAGRDGFVPLARLCLRELGGLPLNISEEIWHELRGKELIMLNDNTSGPPATTGQVTIGTLPFFLFGIFMIMLELPITVFEAGWFAPLGLIVLIGGLLILPSVGFGIGWVQNFPRWSYPYVGMALVMALYIQNASTPGITLFGIPIFGRDLWGWRAWVPLVMAFVIALVVSRSFKPFLRFFTNLWNDWTIPSYLMLGVLPLLVAIAFDEMDRLYTLYFMITFAILFVGMAILYLRSQTRAQRVLILTLGVVVIVFSAELGSNSYWLAHHGTFTTNAEILVEAVKIATIVLIPAWLELLRRSVGRVRLV